METHSTVCEAQINNYTTISILFFLPSFQSKKFPFSFQRFCQMKKIITRTKRNKIVTRYRPGILDLVATLENNDRKF